MAISIEQLLESAADGTIGDLLADPANLSADLANEARTIFKSASAAGQLGTALAAVIAASMMWMQLGDRGQAVLNYVDWQQLEYMRAETPDEYAAARSALLQAMQMAEQIGDRAQMFKAGAIVADCSFWAADSASEPATTERWLTQAMIDLVALEPLVQAEQRADFERFVSLTAATATEAMSVVWTPLNEAQALELLGQLAGMADRVVPVDFTYEMAGDPAKTANTAAALAGLIDEHGT